VKLAFVVVLVVGCGRIDFATATPDGAPVGHDEDGDGVPDSIDVCPHLAGSQIDSDGDGVGDDCDPEPMVPRQRIALFATMQPTDQPFTRSGDDVWELEADSVRFDGNGHGKLDLPLSYGNDVRIVVGATIVTETNAAAQHQISLTAGTPAGQPVDYVEFNQADTIHVASITNFDGISQYLPEVTASLPNGVHPGDVTLEGTWTVGSTLTLDGGWHDEPYHLTFPSSIYNGFTSIALNVNNLVIDIRYVIVIESY
jgi:hypothetical protein